MFINPDIEPCNIRCSFMDILQTETITSYIDYVKLICFIYENKGYNFELYKFKFENFELINNNFCSLFEYNDQKMITDLQIVKINEIGYEEDYYFMIKDLICKNVKANLCILPCFENIHRNDSIKVKKEKLIKSIDYFKTNILAISNSHHSENDILKTKKTLDYHEIKFIKENGWLNDFFEKQTNTTKIENFIEYLNFYDFEILSNKNSNSDVKKKLIFDFLRRNFPVSNNNDQSHLNDVKNKTSNTPTEEGFEPVFMDYKKKFTKVILYLFKKNPENSKYHDFQFPKAVKVFDHYYDEKMISFACTELRNAFTVNESIEFYEKKYILQTNKMIKSV